MKLIGYVFATALLLLGFVFAAAAASTGIWQRWVLAVILVGAGLAVICVLRMKTPRVSITQQIDLSGDVHLEELTCRACGGALAAKDIALREGAIFVACPYCGKSYQVEEAPKW